MLPFSDAPGRHPPVVSPHRGSFLSCLCSEEPHIPGPPRCSTFSSVPHSLLYSTTRPFADTSGCRHDGIRRSLSQLMPLILLKGPRFSLRLAPRASSPLLPSQHFLFPLSSHLHRPAFPAFRSLCHGFLLFSVSESTELFDVYMPNFAFCIHVPLFASFETSSMTFRLEISSSLPFSYLFSSLSDPPYDPALACVSSTHFSGIPCV